MLFSLIKSKLGSSLGRDAVWTLAGQIVIMLCMLIINKIISNEFTVAEFGRYNVIRRSSSVLTFTMLGGIGIALPRYLAIALTKRKIKDIKIIIFSSLIYVSVVCSFTLLVYIICKSYICEFVVGSNTWNDYFIVFIYSFVNCIVSFLIAYYRGLDRFKDFNLIQIVTQIFLTMPLMFILKSVVDVFFWWTVVQLFLVIIFIIREYVSYKKILTIQIPLRTYIEKLKELSIYSIPRLLGDFLLFVMTAFPLLYIAEQSTLDDVSYFSVSITLFTLTTPIFSFLGVILLPYISGFVAENKFQEAKAVISKLFKYYVVLAFVINIIMLLGMKWMITLFFSAEYYDALIPSRIISCALIPASLYYLYRNPIDAVSVKPYNTYILLISFILLVVGFLLSSNIIQYAYTYLGVNIFQGLSSVLSWKFIMNSKRTLKP